MTLEEAIRHCEEVANKCEVEYQKSPYILGYREEFFNNFECAAEHRQLAEWLKELNERRGHDEDVAQIIHCKDCKHQEKFFHEDKRRKEGGYYIFGCELADGYSHVCLDDDYCSRAERKDAE